jgi:hypothetical protein
MTTVAHQHDYSDDQLARSRRLDKAAAIADWLAARHYTAGMAAALSPRARRVVERTVGVNPSGSDKTWTVVVSLLEGMATHQDDVDG